MTCNKTGILRSEPVGLGDSVFVEQFSGGHHPTSGSSGSGINNQLESPAFRSSSYRIVFMDARKLLS